MVEPTEAREQLYDLVYWVNGRPDVVYTSDDPEALLADALQAPWEEPAAPGSGCVIVRGDGRLWAAVTVREVLGACDGVLEVYKPGEPARRVRVTYALDAAGRYDHTEIITL